MRSGRSRHESEWSRRSYSRWDSWERWESEGCSCLEVEDEGRPQDLHPTAANSSMVGIYIFHLRFHSKPNQSVIAAKPDQTRLVDTLPYLPPNQMSPSSKTKPLKLVLAQTISSLSDIQHNLQVLQITNGHQQLSTQVIVAKFQ